MTTAQMTAGAADDVVAVADAPANVRVGWPRGSLAAANLAVREAAAAFELEVARRRRARRAIEAIDAVLEAVEQHNLSRRPRRLPLLSPWSAHLEEQGRLTIPPHILQLQNTARLHGALMDWQDELFNELVPGRADLLRRDEHGEMHRHVLPLQPSSAHPGAPPHRSPLRWRAVA
jgi:hypothetical protein